MADLDAVVLRPGDTLIVRVASDITRDQFDEFVAHLDAGLPDVKKLVIGAEQLLVYRSDPVFMSDGP